MCKNYTYVHIQKSEYRSWLTCEEEEEEDHDDGVSKVEERAGKANNLRLGVVVVDAVEEEVDGCEAWCEERPPPPVVVLQQSLVTVSVITF